MPIEAPIGPLGSGDLDALMALAGEAGWNQTRADWAAMLAWGDGFGVRDDAGRVVASTLVMPYATIGWIGMVLVHGPFRRRGLARRLITEAIVRLRGRSLVPWLDATPAGRPVYEALGFRPIEQIERWRGVGAAAAPSGPALSDARLRIAERLDSLSIGSARGDLLAGLARRPGAFALEAAQGDGAVFVRPGRTAAHLGPLLATEGAVPLLDRALHAIAGPVLLDVPVRETAIARRLGERGFTVERAFTRMALGAAAATGPALRVTAGPELG